MMKNFAKALYLSSFTSIIAAIIYFFASNWHGFVKSEKILLSVGLLVLFYGVSFLVSKKLINHPFLGKWFMVMGSLTFGVTVALLGQIYNSHADSYMLFFVWLLPILLFAIATKYEPFYVISYVLLQLGIWFFIQTKNDFGYMEQQKEFIQLLIVVAINLGIFALSYLKLIPSKIIKVLSFGYANVLLVFMSIGELFHTYGFVLNFIYGTLLIGFVYYLTKKTEEKMLTILSGFFIAVFSIVKYTELAIRYNELFYFGGMLFTALLVFGTVKLVNVISKMEGSHPKTKTFLKNSLLVFATTIGSVIGASSTLGVIFLMGDEAAPYISYFLAIIVFIGLAIRVKNMASAVRYTLLVVGFLMATGVSFFMNELFSLLLITVLIYSWMKINTTGVKYLIYFLGNGLVFSIIIRLMDHGHWFSFVDNFQYILIIMFVLNIILYVFKQYLGKEAGNNSIVYALLPLLSLTFIGDVGDADYLTYNVAFLVIVLAIMLWSKAKDLVFEYRTVSVFWYTFLFLKYYDFGWKLLHKSIGLLIIGLILLTVAILIDRKNTYEKQEINFVVTKWKWIIVIILLQFVIIGGQIIKSEIILNNGETVKIKIAPVDPRSLMQGDYITLEYDISHLSDVYDSDGEKSLPEGKVNVVLRENDEGIYNLAGYYQVHGKWNKEYHAKKGDVIIAGKFDGYGSNIKYGIENYFVEEETGWNLQQKVKYAFVKIGKNGDAIVERITEK